jgi:hypothetical protein
VRLCPGERSYFSEALLLLSVGMGMRGADLVQLTGCIRDLAVSPEGLLTALDGCIPTVCLVGWLT